MSGYAVKMTNSIDERKAADIVEEKHPEFKALGATRLGEGFVVFMGNSDGEVLNDCMYCVSKDGSKVADFNPDVCMDAFQASLDHTVKF